MFRHLLFFMMLLIQTTAFASPHITVVTMTIGDKYKQLVARTIENKRTYSALHGYDFVCGEESLDATRPIPRSKIPLLLQVLENPEVKWVFWTDAQALFTNFAYSLEELTDEQYDIIISRDVNNLNTGNFLIRNCDKSKELLRNIYARTECINHDWREQQGFILEYENKEEVRSMTKIIPQRLINSYPQYTIRQKGWNRQSCEHAQGDFIVHFASVRDPKVLSQLITEYANKVVNDPTCLTLDYYLEVYGFKLSPKQSTNNEGYMTMPQKKQMSERLAYYPNIEKIAEIGLNGGHSAENFFQNCKRIKNFTSFDINHHAYTKAACAYFSRKYKDKFTFISGDSAQTVPDFAYTFPEEKFDLIYIDGSHSFEGCLNDILNMRTLANVATIVWIDDYTHTVKDAVDLCVKRGLLKIDAIHHSQDINNGGRVWIEARYLF